MSDVSESLRSHTKNEPPGAICSHRSEEMSDTEQIAQVAHKKWVNEWIAHSLIFGQKTSNSLGKPMSEFPALAESHFLHITVTTAGREPLLCIIIIYDPSIVYLLYSTVWWLT